MSTQNEFFSLEVRQQLLENVAGLVRERLFDPAFNGRDWNALVDSRRERILGAEQPHSFVQEMQDLVNQLGVTPVHFFHQAGATVPFQRAAWATLFPAGHRWVFQDVHLDGPAFNAGIQPGDTLLGVNRSPVGPPNGVDLPTTVPIMFAIEKREGQHVSVDLEPPPVNKKGSRISRYVSCSELAEHVGYLRISRFPGLVGVDLARDVDGAFRQLEGCDRVIVDLRGNPGGGTGNLRLMSYFTPDRLPVGYSLTRGRAAQGYQREDLPQFRRIPSSKLPLVWLALRFTFADKSIVVDGGPWPQEIPWAHSPARKPAHHQRRRDRCRFCPRAPPGNHRGRANRGKVVGMVDVSVGARLSAGLAGQQLPDVGWKVFRRRGD